MMICSSFSAAVWADDSFSIQIETQGSMLLRGYRMEGTPIQIFNIDQELVWEGVVDLGDETISGLEAGVYLVVGPPDGSVFAALEPPPEVQQEPLP